MRGGVAGEDEQARRVPVEPVDDPGTDRVIAAAQAFEQLDQRRLVMPRGRVDDESGALVDDDDVVV